MRFLWSFARVTPTVSLSNISSPLPRKRGNFTDYSREAYVQLLTEGKRIIHRIKKTHKHADLCELLIHLIMHSIFLNNIVARNRNLQQQKTDHLQDAIVSAGIIPQLTEKLGMELSNKPLISQLIILGRAFAGGKNQFDQHFIQTMQHRLTEEQRLGNLRFLGYASTDVRDTLPVPFFIPRFDEVLTQSLMNELSTKSFASFYHPRPSPTVEETLLQLETEKKALLEALSIPSSLQQIAYTLRGFTANLILIANKKLFTKQYNDLIAIVWDTCQALQVIKKCDLLHKDIEVEGDRREVLIYFSQYFLDLGHGLDTNHYTETLLNLASLVREKRKLRELWDTHTQTEIELINSAPTVLSPLGRPPRRYIHSV